MTEKKIGRPTDYSDELAAEILSRIAMGESMRSVCRDPAMPCMYTFYNWLKKHTEFKELYQLAKEDSADAWADDIIDIADNQVEQPLIVDGLPMQVNDQIVMVKDMVSIRHAQLRVDARKWAASKLKPKKYGDRLATHLSGETTVNVKQITRTIVDPRHTDS